jgi:hypothetical protein
MTEDPKPMPVASLSWGVKQSFRGYVETVGGVTETDAGAGRAADGGFTFPAAPDTTLSLAADGTLAGIGRFLGEVRFQAHGGMLKVCLADPILEIGPSGAAVTVADSSARTFRLEIARLDLAATTPGELGEIVIPAALTIEGMQLLGDHYPPKTPLDPVRLLPAKA